jgi:hypothetical protein
MSGEQVQEITPAAKLDQLMSNPEFRQSYLAGNGPQVREAHALMEAKIADTAGADARLDQIVAGTAIVEIGETTTRGEISTWNAMQTAGWLRDIGLSDPQIKQALAGKPVPRAEYDAIKTLRSDREGNKEWAAKYLAGDAQARREMACMNMVIANGYEGQEQWT